MKRRLALGIALAAMVVAPGHAAQRQTAQATYLLSIADLPLAANEYAESFDIETWGVQIIAVCQIPPDWTISAGTDSAVTGSISGQAGHGVSAISRASHNLDLLRDLVLVRVSPRASDRPPFSGSIRIGRYGSETFDRTQSLTAANFHRTPARQCPPPRPNG